METTEKDQNFKFLSHLKLPSVTSVIHVSTRNGSSHNTFRQAMEPPNKRYNSRMQENQSIPTLKKYVDELVEQEEQI